MTFWGTEVKPGKPFILEPDEDAKLILTQATLGNCSSSSKKSTLQVTVGDGKPVFICTLLPDKTETASLNLEFDEDDEVTFSVVGQTSIHLSGFFQMCEPDEDDCNSEDMCGAESEDSEFESEYGSEDGFSSDDDMPAFPPSPARNSGVVIEEIEEDEKAAKENGKAEQQIVVKGSTVTPVLESEDEDGFPVSSKGKSSSVNCQANTESKASNEGKKKKNKKKKDAKDDGDSENKLKRKVDAMDNSDEPERDASENLKKKKKKKKVAKTENEVAVENSKQNASEVAVGREDASKADKKISKADKGTKQSKEKPGKVRTFSNGMTIEELAMGKPNGKRASNGKKVSIHYTGKLQKTGKIFDSSMNRSPIKFRLGVGQVIKGWDTGIEGMRVGDKRRLTIPPAFGYGAEGAKPQIPPNAWLVFDVELVDVN